MEQSCNRLEKEVALLTQQVTEDRQQAQAGVEARRNAEATSQDRSQSTQTESGSKQSSASADVSLLQENDRLKRERAQLRAELARMSRAVQELESQVAVSQDENANLSTGMEELDIQHQEAIQQIMVLKDSTQKRYEVLITEYEDMKQKYDDLVRTSAEKLQKNSIKDVDCQTSSTVPQEDQSGIPTDLTDEIKNMITTQIPDKYFETSKECASGLETLAALEKMLSHTMARVESCEGKIKELIREVESKNNEVQEIEEENKTLRMKIDELKEQCDNLPTIAENSEDLEALESKINMLENEISILREVRSNLEVEHCNSRTEINSLIMQLQTAEAMIRNHDNLQMENSKFKENEQDLLRKLNNAENSREEMLSEMSHLQKTIDEQDKLINDLKKSRLKEEELTHINDQLQEDLNRRRETELLHLKVSEELEKEKSARKKLEEEKELLFAELTKLKNSEINLSKQSAELEKEHSLRVQLEEENIQLQKRILSLEDADKEHVKLLESLQSETALKKQLEESLDTMHDEVKHLEKECDSYKSLIEQLNVDSDVKVKELKVLNSHLTQKCVNFDKEIFDLSEKVDGLKIEIDSKDRKLCELILEKSVTDKELEVLTSQKCIVERESAELKTELLSKEGALLNESKNIFREVFEMISLTDNFLNSDFHTYLSEIAKCIKSLHEDKNQLVSENLSLKENISFITSEVNEKTECITKLTAQIETLQAEKHSIEDRLRNLKETISIGNQTDKPDTPEVTQEDYTEMYKKLEEKEKRNQELEENYKNLLSSSDQSLTHVNDQLRNLHNERQQLIETVQTKHAECLKYHAEIQRLCAELTKSEKLRSTVTADLQRQLEDKEEQLSSMEASNTRQVAALNQQLATLQNQLDYVSQLLKVSDRQEAEGQPATESHEAKTQSGKTEAEEKEARRVDELYESLQQEQLRNKYLQDEVSEQHEKEASLLRELERLRGHMVLVEESHDQDMLRAEQQVQELSQRLALAEERAKSSSTAYTSASIRANQQVESFGSQLRLVTEQKEKLSAQLATAEDKLHKQAAALTNLQIVLEQFQRDKERDVAMENDRIRQTLQQANNKNMELSNEIKALQLQLKEAKEGLSAASRLTEQLDQKSRLIAELRHEVSELTEKLKKADERIQAASVNVEGKVDRCLLRNLLVGYLSAPPSSQPQALGIIATVLDFTQEDRQKSGIDPNAKYSSHKQQSLSEAFVRFLEHESRPQPQLRLSVESEGARSRKTSFSEVGLPPARRTSGSVLKDVLKQDL